MFISSCSLHLNWSIIWLLTTYVIFFTVSVSFVTWLFESRWCLVSSRSRCVMAFVCSNTAVRTGKACKYFSMAAGCWPMPVKSFVLALRLHIPSSVQTPLKRFSGWHTMNYTFFNALFTFAVQKYWARNAAYTKVATIFLCKGSGRADPSISRP